jgi:hypothetical protein
MAARFNGRPGWLVREATVRAKLVDAMFESSRDNKKRSLFVYPQGVVTLLNERRWPFANLHFWILNHPTRLTTL